MTNISLIETREKTKKNQAFLLKKLKSGKKMREGGGGYLHKSHQMWLFISNIFKSNVISVNISNV